MVKGMVVKCRRDLSLEEILFNSLVEELHMDSVKTLYDMVPEDDRGKLEGFAEEMAKEGFVFEREISLRDSNLSLPLKFTGGKLEDGYFVFMLKTNDDIPFLYEELMKVNNEQANYIRSMVGKYVQSDADRKDQDVFYNEISSMNNELANLHRELEQKNAELSLLNRQKNEFLGIAAHDLRNPLSSISFYLDFIMEESETLTEQQKEYLQQVKHLSKSMLNLVNELLDISAIESGRIRLNPVEIELNELVEGTINSYRNMADQKEIETVIVHQQTEIQIIADADRLRQVLVNLYSNAVKFSERNTKIEIIIRKNKSGAQVSITDQGKGIAKEEQKLLFNPFQQTNTRATESEKGSGLGLFIVKKIIDAHKGKIEVESEPGSGSSLILTLPVKD